MALDVGLEEVRELTVVPVRRREGLRLGRRIGLFVVLEQDPVEAEVTLVDPVALKFLLDLGSSKLPVNVFSRLLHQAKVATRLCGDCGSSLETEEPVLGTRSGLTSGKV